MAKLTALDKIERIKQLRASGATLQEIANKLDISPSTAYRRGKEYTPHDKRYTWNICGLTSQRFGVDCQRYNGHEGVHLADSESGLVYWE